LVDLTLKAELRSVPQTIMALVEEAEDIKKLGDALVGSLPRQRFEAVVNTGTGGAIIGACQTALAEGDEPLGYGALRLRGSACFSAYFL
jgi:hypothetical protein